MYFVLINCLTELLGQSLLIRKKKIVAIVQNACNKSCFKLKLFIQKPIYYCCSNQCVFLGVELLLCYWKTIVNCL